MIAYAEGVVMGRQILLLKITAALVLFGCKFNLSSCIAAPVDVSGLLSADVGSIREGGVFIFSNPIFPNITNVGATNDPGRGFARNSRSFASFVFIESENRATLQIETEQTAAIPTSGSFHQVLVQMKGNLSIDAGERTIYSFDGAYEFESAAPGTDFFAFVSLVDAESAESLFDWQRRTGEGSLGGVVEIRDAVLGPLDEFVGSTTGFLEAGRQYELLWGVEFANPLNGVATGQTTVPWEFDFLLVPEPSSILLLIATTAYLMHWRETPIAFGQL